MQAGDHCFKDYWSRKKEQIDDGEGNLVNADWEAILSRGITKFNALQDDWGKKSEEEEIFIALKSKYEAELESLRGQLELKTPAPAKATAAKKSKGKSNSSSKVK